MYPKATVNSLPGFNVDPATELISDIAADGLMKTRPDVKSYSETGI